MVGDGLEVDHAEVLVAPPGDHCAHVAGGEHRVQRVVQRRPAVDGEQVLVRVVRDGPGGSQVTQPRPVHRPLAGVEHDHRPILVRLGPADHLGRVLTDHGRGRLGQLDVAHPAEGELLQRGAGTDEVLDELVGRSSEDDLGGVVLGDLGALLEDQDPVAQLDRLVDVVGDADDGLAEFLLNAQQLVLQPLPGDRVDGAERLVHQDHRRVRRQPAGDADALLLAAGELSWVAVAVAGRIEADELEQLVHPGAGTSLVPLEQSRYEADVLGHGEVREEAAALDHVADRASQFVLVALPDVVTVDQDRALGGFDQPVDHLQRGGLAAAGRAHEHDDLAGRDVQAERLDRCPLLPPVPLDDVLQFDVDAADLGVVRRSLVHLGRSGGGGLRHGSPWRWSGARRATAVRRARARVRR